MLKPCTTFACKTDDHNRATEGLSRCADLLYEWLLRQSRAGSPTEIHLEAFQEFQQHRFKGRGYSLAWIKQALKELVEVKLVDVAFKFSSKIFKLITWHPDRQSAADLKKSLESARKSQQTSEKNREKQPSNPYPTATLYRDSRETTDNTTHHPVNPDEREGAIDSPKIPTPPEPEIEPKILEQIQTAGFQLNSTLKAIVRSTQAQIVLQAIEAAQQYITKLQQKNQPLRRRPEALLVSAIREAWQPQRGESGTNAIPPEFDEWFRLAKGEQVASASSIQADLTQHPPGMLCVLTPSGWEPFDQMRVAYSIKRLQGMKADRESVWDYGGQVSRDETNLFHRFDRFGLSQEQVAE
jgi:hypothetical protein